MNEWENRAPTINFQHKLKPAICAKKSVCKDLINLEFVMSFNCIILLIMSFYRTCIRIENIGEKECLLADLSKLVLLNK